MGLNHTASPAGHEQRDISFGAVVMFAIGLAVALIVVHFVAGHVFHHLAGLPSGYPRPSLLSNVSGAPTGPGLLVNQSADMEELRASEDAVLNSYGWVDRDRGIVHIPIDRAMDLLTETNRGALP